MAAWTVVTGACGAALIAGIYFNVFQVDWHAFDLKNWWDGGMGVFTSPSWALYRHGERDLLEPALFIMAGKTLLARPKYWGAQVATWRLALTPVVLVAAAAGLAAGGIWLLDFGLPRLWHALLGGYRVTAPPVISHSSWQEIVLGLAIGLVLHPLWAPVGATLQGHYLRTAATRAHARGGTPLWVRYPLAPPVVRERYESLRDTYDTVVDDGGGALRRWGIAAGTVLAAYLVITGFIAHYWLGTGHTIPALDSFLPH
jgi:hypothetical protein